MSESNSESGAIIGRPKRKGNRSEYLLKKAQQLIAEKFGIEGFDPVIYLIMVAADSDEPTSLRVAAASKAAPFVHAGLKTVELTGADGGPIDISVSESKNRLGQLLQITDKGFQESIIEDQVPEAEYVDV